MPSNWGRRNNLPGYDQFRTGLTYRDAYNMLATSKKHRYRRKGSVLGFMHELKRQLYEQAVDLGYLETLGGTRHDGQDGTTRAARRTTAYSASDHGTAREDRDHTGTAVVRRIAHGSREGSRDKEGAPLQADEAARHRPRNRRVGEKRELSGGG